MSEQQPTSMLDPGEAVVYRNLCAKWSAFLSPALEQPSTYEIWHAGLVQALADSAVGMTLARAEELTDLSYIEATMEQAK
jgi:hypothetical protein